MLQWINTAGLLSNFAKCHFRQAKLSSWLHNFSIVTETRSKLRLCSYRRSATKRKPKRSFLFPTLWFAQLFPKYALGMSTLKMLLCSFLVMVQDRIFVDSSTKCWSLTVFEICRFFFCWNLGRQCWEGPRTCFKSTNKSLEWLFYWLCLLTQVRRSRELHGESCGCLQAAGSGGNTWKLEREVYLWRVETLGNRDANEVLLCHRALSAWRQGELRYTVCARETKCGSLAKF